VKLSSLRDALSRIEVRPSKTLGQNFLHDQNLAEWIVAQLELARADHLVEVGPGLGALTEFALPQCRAATLIEKDGRLAGFLRERFAGSNAEIVHCDALEYDPRVFFPRQPVKVLGNLPYYITTPLLFGFTADPSPFSRLIFTIQRELAARLAAEPSTKEYGGLTLIIGRRWKVKYLRTLPGTVFTPEPKVDSGVILLTPREPGDLPECDGARFQSLVKNGFSQRRKQLRKMLAGFRLDWPAIATALGVPETARAEELSLRQWVDLTNLSTLAEPGQAQDIHGELFDVVDSENRVTGTASRHAVHTGGLSHRAVHIFVFNRAGNLFLQKRSRHKDMHPLKWDSSAAGHVNSGQDYVTTARRELIEELGIEAPITRIGAIPSGPRTGYEFVELYRAESEGPFQLAPAEIDSGGFFPLRIVDEWVQARPEDFATGFLECYALFRGVSGGG
jgi:16S rRNA (adenine1518-N6/adenine1519-N6)-dimethyltransferase